MSFCTTKFCTTKPAGGLDEGISCVKWPARRELQAGLRDLPHSRQQDLWRGVIRPQNGHILCEAKFRSRGFIAARSLANESRISVSRMRKRLWSRRRSIDVAFRPFRCAGTVSSCRGPSASEKGLIFRTTGSLTMPHPDLRFCAGLLTFAEAFRLRAEWNRLTCSHDHARSEQFRPAMLSRFSDHGVETSTPSRSFRSSEPSQLI